MIELTENAVQKIKDFSLKEPGKIFRLKLLTGGCNGFEYSTVFSDKTSDDVSYITNSVEIIIDRLSDSMLPHLKIDYVDSLAFSGFKFDNPGAISKCGCGQSFSL